MKKILSLMTLFILSVTAAWATAASVTYALSEGDTFTSGQTVDVKKGTLTVATITYGEAGGADFTAAQAGDQIDGFTAFTAGNGVNGNKEGGTFYTITPVYDGTIDVAVALNADKKFYIEEDGVALTAYNGITVAEKYYGTYEFTAKAGSSYKIYCAGSKLGFYGFKYDLSDFTVAGSSTALFVSSWDPSDTNNDMVLDEETGLFKWEKANVELTAGTVEFKVVKDHAWATSYPGSNYEWTVPADGTYFASITFNASTKAVNATLTKIDQVDLRGDFTDWSTSPIVLTQQGATYTYTCDLDLSTTVADQEFKLVINDDQWIGWNALTLDAPSGWVVAQGGDGSNFILKNSTAGYKTYTFTATWVPNADAKAGWTLKIEGNDARAHKTINVGFTNNMGWDKVYAYTFDPMEQSGAWPGTEMTKDGTQTLGTTTYDYYSYSFEGYESYPTKIIFNDGGSGDGHQTANLTLIAGQAYSGPLYCVVGRAEAFGNWDAAATTAIMDPVGDGTYTFSQDDVALGKDFDFKIIKRLYWGYNGDPLAWYPYTANPSFSSTQVAGKYNMEFKFDPAADMSSQIECWEGSTATKTYEAVTIGTAGWATTVTNSPLNFADLKGTFKAYTATLSTNTVTLNEVDDVQAETGLVLKGATGTHYIPVIASSSTDKGNLGFSSTITYTVNDSYKKCFGLTIKNEKAQFVKIKNAEVIPAQKAFLQVEPSTPANEFTVVFEDESGEATGIQTLNAERNTLYGETYNLAGQKVNKSYKGLVISNGRKVIVK